MYLTAGLAQLSHTGRYESFNYKNQACRDRSRSRFLAEIYTLLGTSRLDVLTAAFAGKYDYAANHQKHSNSHQDFSAHLDSKQANYQTHQHYRDEFIA